MKTGTLDVDEGEDETDGTDIFSLTSQSSLSSTSDCGQEGGDYEFILIIHYSTSHVCAHELIVLKHQSQTSVQLGKYSVYDSHSIICIHQTLLFEISGEQNLEKNLTLKSA